LDQVKFQFCSLFYRKLSFSLLLERQTHLIGPSVLKNSMVALSLILAWLLKGIRSKADWRSSGEETCQNQALG